MPTLNEHSLRHSDVVIEADPMYLYQLVTDVTRAPEWTDAVRRATWLDAAPDIRAGARFVVRPASRLRRARHFEVQVASPGRAFAFGQVSRPGRPSPTTWSFSFEPVPGGTRLAAQARVNGRSVPVAQVLSRMAATAEGRRTRVQPSLGQAHTAEGPLDLSAMLLMHHGFRRDLRDLVRVVPLTPLDDAEAWAALERRWTGMATALHHHHSIEDDALWPPLLARVNAVGDADSRTALDAMESEHALLDPALGRCADGFKAMVATPEERTRTQLARNLEAAQALLLEHLEHEERCALPLAQAHLSLAAWDAFGEAALKEYGIADIAFAVPWSSLEVPEDQFAIAYAHGGTFIKAILAVTRRRFEREHRIAFRHLPGV